MRAQVCVQPAGAACSGRSPWIALGTSCPVVKTSAWSCAACPKGGFQSGAFSYSSLLLRVVRCIQLSYFLDLL